MVSINSVFRIFFCSLFLGFLFVGCASDAASSSGKSTDDGKTAFTKSIPPSEFLAKYKENPGATIIDVRTPKEFFSGKMVPEAVNIDYHGDEFLTQISVQDRNAPIFVYCFSGGRSSKAAYKMRQLGFDRIYECKGGYQQWEKENKK